jgi:hypothetical protein
MVIAAASAGALLGGCEDNNRAATSAKELWSRVQPVYTSWSSPSAFKELRPSETLHKRKVRVFFNDLMQPHHVDRETCQQRADEGVSGGVIIAQAGLTEWPLGSVIVKEGHDDGLEIIAMMEKRDHGWFYAEYDASGEVLFSGKSPQLCVSCHAGALHDFTFTAHLSYKCP